nr:adenylyltransferase/cytidyltransferase family protein [Ruminococcus sp. AF46-10NS]
MKKVITYGTFDLFHQGHYNILKRARELGDYLIVGVTSESYDIERGKLNVKDSLLKRIENVRKTGFADEIIVEEYQGRRSAILLNIMWTVLFWALTGRVNSTISRITVTLYIWSVPRIFPAQS